MHELSGNEKFHIKSMWEKFEPAARIAEEIGIDQSELEEYLKAHNFPEDRPAWAMRIIARGRMDEVAYILKGEGNNAKLSMSERINSANALRDKIVTEIFKSTEDNHELSLYERAHLTIEEIAQKFKTTPDAVVEVLNNQMSARNAHQQE